LQQIKAKTDDNDKWDLEGVGAWHAIGLEFLFQAFHLHTRALLFFVGIFLFPYKLPHTSWR